MKLQKYLLKAFFNTKHGADFDLVPIFEVSKEEVLRKLNENLSLYEKFTLYNFDWDSKEIAEFGMPEIMTVSEFWKEDGYV